MELTKEQAAELLGAYALDAIDDAERRAVEARLAEDPRLAAEADRLRAAAGLLGAGEAGPAPSGLRDAVLRGALRARPPGPRAATASPRRIVALFRRQVEEFAALLATIPDDAWAAPTASGWTVHELVAHLVGVEAYLAGALGLEAFAPPPGTEHDHVAMTVPVVEAHRSRPPAETRSEWRRRAEAVLAHLEELDDEALGRRVDLYGLDASLRLALVTRIFELWAHADDVRHALGLLPAAPDPERLGAMSGVAVRSLPLGLALAGRSRPGRSAKIVLLGPGGGTWTVPLGLGEGAGVPDVTVVADVVDFCRLAAKRLPPEELAHDVRGDADLAHDVLVGAQVFAS